MRNVWTVLYKREAFAHYAYGRWVDATIVGLDPEASYYEADAAEAICAGFEGKTAEEMASTLQICAATAPATGAMRDPANSATSVSA